VASWLSGLPTMHPKTRLLIQYLSELIAISEELGKVLPK
jgi:hypothetical protein